MKFLNTKQFTQIALPEHFGLLKMVIHQVYLSYSKSIAIEIAWVAQFILLKIQFLKGNHSERIGTLYGIPIIQYQLVEMFIKSGRIVKTQIQKDNVLLHLIRLTRLHAFVLKD